MNNALKVVIGLVGVVAMLGGIAAVSFVGTNNDLVAQEAGIKAQYKQNQNNYDNFVKKVREAAQVPSMYAGDLEKVYKAAITGRYGKDGSKAVFQFLKEQNPNLDSTMYVKIQQLVESGRNSFEADQKTLLDKKRVYEISLGQFPGNIVAGMLGFPRIDLDKFDIVTSQETEDAFDKKKADAINIKGN